MARRTTRRQFMQTSAAVGVGFWTAGGVTLGDDKKSPNETVNIACIGVGGKGSSDTDHAAQFGNVVAICDIDDNTLNGKGSKLTKAKKYNDFRKMLEEMHKGIDAVTVSTPDHTHAVAAMMAMKMGKHVYCQKPLTHTVAEARLLRETASKMKVVTQMGNQGSALDGLREAVEVVQAGAIGPVKEVHIWTNRPGTYWPQSPDVVARPEASEPPPHVHWDLWIGPAPMRPYSSAKQKNKRPPYHDFSWRGWWDFGTGALGDMACHLANMTFRALKLGYPTSIVAENEKLNAETYPGWAKITFEFPARGDQPPVKFIWYEGLKDGQKMLPPMALFQGETPRASGALLVGAKGTLHQTEDYGANYTLLPKKDFEGFKKPAPTIERWGKGSNDEHQKQEWIRAIKDSSAVRPYANFDYAAMLTETILLGNIAMKAGKKLEWDGPNMKFTNAPEANQWLKSEYRKGWSL